MTDAQITRPGAFVLLLGLMAVDVPWLRAVAPVLAVAAWAYRRDEGRRFR